MASQESTLGAEGVNVYFVIPSKYATDKECSDDMWLAYNKCEEFDINPIWLTEQKCKKLKPEKTDVFVMEEFLGQIFDYLKNSKCSIVGPRCLLCCLMNNEPIPEGSSPVYVTAMRDLIICASGFPVKVKNEIQEKVEYMGGIFSKQLLSSVTHLITDRIMSQKYENAIKIPTIKVMTIDWVNAVWKENLSKFIKATDLRFDRYKCPVFLNTYITATDLDKNQKLEIKKLVNSNGGEYMGQLDGAKTNILITSGKGTLTEKLKFALQKDIACLKYPWIIDSIKAGYALPFDDYLVTTSKACSTPEKSNATLNFSCISVIPCDNQNGIVDDSMALSTMSRLNSTCSASNMLSNITLASNKESYMNFLDGITLANVKKLGPFLDGCNIYLAGFQPKYKEKLNKVINVSSATRMDEITDTITHVLVGDVIKAKNDIKIIYSNGQRPHVVNVNWLEESMALKQPAPEEGYLIETEETSQKNPEPPSPLSKKNLEMLRRPQKPPPPPLFDASKKYVEDFNEPDLLEEYSRKTTTVSNKSMAEVFQISKVTTQEKEKQAGQTLNSISASLKNRTRESESLVPLSQTDTIVDKFFKGLTFLISGFQPSDYQELVVRIRALGGEIVSRSYAGIADYGVVPFSGGTLRETVAEIVTDMFIDDCVDKDQFVPLEYYHRPVVLRGDVKPLENCVIAISTYGGQERQFLQQLAEVLGAMHQDTFARKTNLEKKTLASTHLICPSPEGNKYNAALRWKVPAVSADWLLKCAEKMEFVDETHYLIGQSIMPEPQNLERLKAKLNTPRAATPTRVAAIQQQETPGMKTPLVNKRLSAIMNKTPQSPFHINTPETPYGAMFKENPSPDTRKGWVKWINEFPDMRDPVQPPPPKRRAPSTPFSELKRQMWDRLKGPLDETSSRNASLNESSGTSSDEPAFRNEEQTNRRLSYSDENNPTKPNHIDLQIAKLDKALRASSGSSGSVEKRISCINNVKEYHLEPEPQKCMAQETQAFTVGWKYPQACEQNTEPQNEPEASESKVIEETQSQVTTAPVEPKRKFMLSGLKDRVAYETVIVNLGGEMSQETTIDFTATHLICGKPTRNEKFLGSIAAGKWILHHSYIKDCEAANKFLDEEEYEWANPHCNREISSSLTTEIERAIAAAAYRWRLKLADQPGGAFEGMVALLIVPEEKYDSFERLIIAGNGTVVQPRSSYDPNSSDKKITHCFVQLKQKDQAVDYARMASKGILCFQPQYLHNLLTSETPLNPRENVLPDFKKYLALLPK